MVCIWIDAGVVLIYIVPWKGHGGRGILPFGPALKFCLSTDIHSLIISVPHATD